MKKPLFILITDTHLNKNNVEVVFNIFEQCFKLCEKIGVKVVFHLGDFFTNRTAQNLNVLLAMQNILDLALNYGITIIGIDGNHDKTMQEDTNSYNSIFKSHKSFQLIQEEQIVDFHGISCCFLPYFKEDGSYSDRLNNLCLKAKKTNNKTNYLFTHIAVNGVRNNGGFNVTNDLTQDKFRFFSKVFVGHYHNKSKVGKNIYYIGSARPKDFGEDNDKGFTVLYDDGSHEQVIANFKKYIKIEVDLDTIDKKELDKLFAKYQNSEDFIRFVFKGSKEKLQILNTNKYKSVGIDVKKEDKEMMKAIELASNKNTVEFNYNSILKNFYLYCSKNKINPVQRKRGMEYLKLIENK